jgi:hypothetical protein
MALAVDQTIADRQWFIALRWQEYAGEARANLLRLFAVGVFYGVQLVHFYRFAQRDAADILFHQRATAIAVAWTLVALAVMLCLRVQWFSGALKYVSATCDLLLLTALAWLGRGPESPLVLGYFLIIALSALRFSLGLVWFSTVSGMLAYWSLVGLVDKRWFDAEHAVPPVTQLLTLASLAFTGIVIGQTVRCVKRVASEYAARLEQAS